MDELGELAIGLIIAVSIVGIIVPILPGLLVEILAVFVWAAVTGGAVAWGVAIFALLVGGVGTFVKYAVPKRHLSEGGIPNRTLIVATVVAAGSAFAAPNSVLKTASPSAASQSGATARARSPAGTRPTANAARTTATVSTTGGHHAVVVASPTSQTRAMASLRTGLVRPRGLSS